MNKEYSNLIADFLISHPLISAQGLEKTLGLPNSAIRHALFSRHSGKKQKFIPTKHIWPIVCHLADYGLEINGYQLKYDPADGLLSGRKTVKTEHIVEQGKGFIYIIQEYRIIAASYPDLPTPNRKLDKQY